MFVAEEFFLCYCYEPEPGVEDGPLFEPVGRGYEYGEWYLFGVAVEVEGAPVSDVVGVGEVGGDDELVFCVFASDACFQGDDEVFSSGQPNELSLFHQSVGDHLGVVVIDPEVLHYIF